MKNTYGKLSVLAIVLAVAFLLLAPMRSGEEDMLTVSTTHVELDPGAAAQVTYELEAQQAQTVSYRTDNPSVATVDQMGNITAVAPGKTKVRLTAQRGATAVVDVEVSGVPITSFSLNVHEMDMNKGDISGLSCRFNNGATVQSVVWTSADPGVVRVDSAGRITAVGAGQTYVTATTGSGLSDQALIRVSVRADSVQIVPGELTVGVGANFRLGVRYMPEDATDEVTRWTSNAPRIVSVSEDGLVHAVSTGTATVMATTRSGLMAATLINVEQPTSDFQLSPTNVTIERGDTHPLQASFFGADGQVAENVNHHIEWTSSNPDVVSVENGYITGLASGVATVTASADGIEAAAIVNVRTSVREVVLNITEQTLYKEQTGEPFQLKATVYPEDADDPKLVYSTDNPLVANVSPEGLVTMTGGYGTAVISAEASSGAKAVCSVHVVVPQVIVEAEEEEQP